MPVHNSWPAEMEKIAKGLFEKGISPREIAGLIPKTRNAIIGKSNRDGWDTSKQKRKRSSPAKKVHPKPHQFANQFDFRRHDMPQGKGSFAPIEPLETSAPETDLLIPETQRIGLRDDWPTTCCVWPVGDPKKPGFFFCGSPRESEKPYCVIHNERAKRKAGEIEITYTT